MSLRVLDLTQRNSSSVIVADLQHRIESGIKSELRRAIRKHSHLTNPLNDFELDSSREEGAPCYLLRLEPNQVLPTGEGVRVSIPTITYPDERIEDMVYDLARCIWHLNDWTKQWKLVTDVAVSHEQCASVATVPGWREVLIARDLITKKKHARIKRLKSGCDPWLDLVQLDVSKGKPVEIWYSDATRQLSVMLTERVEVPFSIDICKGDGSGDLYQRPDRDEPVVIGNAANVLMKGLYFWFNWVVAAGLLSDDRPENHSLLQVHAELLLHRDAVGHR